MWQTMKCCLKRSLRCSIEYDWFIHLLLFCLRYFLFIFFAGSLNHLKSCFFCTGGLMLIDSGSLHKKIFAARHEVMVWKITKTKKKKTLLFQMPKYIMGANARFSIFLEFKPSDIWPPLHRQHILMIKNLKESPQGSRFSGCVRLRFLDSPYVIWNYSFLEVIAPF